MKDDRGTLAVFDKLENLDLKRFYVIECLEGKWRGDHYHELSTQTICLIEGRLSVIVTSPTESMTIEMKAGEIFVQRPRVKFRFCSLEKKSTLVVLCDKEHDSGDYYTGEFKNE
jgi:mannose-6-phosphate isomerase-like protein (cupin superfamily)